MPELSIDELESEHAETLPERETLFFNTYFIHNNAIAVAGLGFVNVATASNNVVIIG